MEEKFKQLLLALHEEQMEHNARLIVQQYLLENLYADRFAGNPAGFAQDMERLIFLATKAPTKSEPMPDETAMEVLVRVRTRLLRFQQLTARRIADRDA